MRGYYFRAARAILGKNIELVAKECNISKNTISKIEKSENIKNLFSTQTLTTYYKNNGIDITNKGFIILEFESNI